MEKKKPSPKANQNTKLSEERNYSSDKPNPSIPKSKTKPPPKPSKE